MALDVWCLWHQSLSANMGLRLDTFSKRRFEKAFPPSHASQFGWGRHSCHWCAGYRYSWVAPRAEKLYIFSTHT